MEIMSINCPATIKIQAAAFAESKIGLPYNDIFSPNCINSGGEASYYCSQLITEAYKGKFEFPEHKLNFRTKGGKFIEFWQQYYEERRCKIPQGEEGSHPSSIRRASELEMRLSRSFLQGMLRIGDVTDALHFINGAQVNFTSGKKFEVIEPRSGCKLVDCHSATTKEVAYAVEVAHKSQSKWYKMGWLERGNVLKNVSQILTNHCEEISRWESLDSGKPLYEARLDLQSCIDTFNYFAGLGQALMGDHIPLQQDLFAYTKREPFGVVGCIGAWNYPLQTCTWKVAPALACGNSVVYKPSPLTPVSAIILAKVLQFAGLPDGVFNVVQVKFFAVL
ncbi:betaine-aldehyde dehydrogenase domain protein [Dictyocaulus viviparus]|uniref:Betaine-aldehyde dehydrogenase domain protein n=1 Tax=Dictyocaulus viviparus TaxID=29172 RepID=A0A0D8Y492_DICVI|nr:betaine-aldehyde dehydrogenase domain protein [Dictyocaulus viviparus]